MNMNLSRKLFNTAFIILLIIPFFSVAAKDRSFITITVQKGDTLSKIAGQHLENPRRWKELLEYNNIKNPNLIRPGLKLKIPGFLQKKPVATVSFAVGDAKVKPVDAAWQKALVGKGLHNGTHVKTGKGKMMMQTSKGSILKVSVNSQLVLNSDGNLNTVNLQRGSIYSNITRQKNNGRFRVRTPVAVLAVRGTEFFSKVDNEENDSSIFACYEGLVDVSAQGETVQLEPGFATRVNKGRPPLKPFKLKPAPELIYEK